MAGAMYLGPTPVITPTPQGGSQSLWSPQTPNQLSTWTPPQSQVLGQSVVNPYQNASPWNAISTVTQPPQERESLAPKNVVKSVPQSSGSDWSTIYSTFYPGWNEAQARADFQGAYGGDVNRLAMSRGFSAGGSDGGVSEADINAIYAPGQEYLNTLESQYRAELPEAEKAVETSYEEAMIPIQEREATGKAQISEQEQETEAEKTNALAQARQVFNELSQGLISKFGAGTSTGPAASEILGRQVQQQFGGIQQTAAKALSKLADEGRRLTDFVGRQKEVLKQKKAEAITNLRNEFNRNLAQVQATRGQLESEKAAKRLDQLNRYREQAFQIEQADKAFQRQIDLFKLSKEEQLSNKFSVDTGISKDAINVFSQLAKYMPAQEAWAMAGLPSQMVEPVPGKNYSAIVSPSFKEPWKWIAEKGMWYNEDTGEYSATGPEGTPGGTTGYESVTPGLFNQP